MIYKIIDRESKKIELEIMSQLSHPNIVSYIDHFEDSKSFYLVMEQFGSPCKFYTVNFVGRVSRANNEVFAVASDLAGETKHSLLSVVNGSSASLFDYIDEFGSVPSHLLLLLFKQIASALGYLHQLGIVHGDIKEENILIGYDEGVHLVKICDFGHSFQTKRNRKDLRFYGTRDISAPELFPNLRASENDAIISDAFNGYAEDIWALGLVLYTMIHGSLPQNNDQIVDGIESLDGAFYYPTVYAPHIEKGSLNLKIIN
jgi:serine/threonine protein kinase